LNEQLPDRIQETIGNELESLPEWLRSSLSTRLTEIVHNCTADVYRAFPRPGVLTPSTPVEPDQIYVEIDPVSVNDARSEALDSRHETTHLPEGLDTSPGLDPLPANLVPTEDVGSSAYGYDEQLAVAMTQKENHRLNNTELTEMELLQVWEFDHFLDSQFLDAIGPFDFVDRNA